MDPIHIKQEEMAYIRSESEFSRAKMKGFFETIMGLITGHDMHLLSFDEVVDKLRLRQSNYLGLQDIPVDHITGSTGRYEDFTRRFLPRASGQRDKERWRNIYTLAVTGKGFPPIDVYKIDQVYFVKDGNHRVSVARGLGWPTIQAHVTELPSSISLDPDVDSKDLLIKSECADFLEKTQLDQTRPDSKQHIDLTELGGYQRLLKHIRLCRHLLQHNRKQEVTLPEAAAHWYDQIYLPIIQAVRQEKIIKHFPKRQESDLYLWLINHQQAWPEQYNLAQVEAPAMIKEFLQTIDQARKTT